jgi:hypothetical protein
MLEKENTFKSTKPQKRNRAALDDDYRSLLLAG